MSHIHTENDAVRLQKVGHIQVSACAMLMCPFFIQKRNFDGFPQAKMFRIFLSVFTQISGSGDTVVYYH